MKAFKLTRQGVRNLNTANRPTKRPSIPRFIPAPLCPHAHRRDLRKGEASEVERTFFQKCTECGDLIAIEWY